MGEDRVDVTTIEPETTLSMLTEPAGRNSCAASGSEMCKGKSFDSETSVKSLANAKRIVYCGMIGTHAYWHVVGLLLQPMMSVAVH